MEELAILLEACAPRLNRDRFWTLRHDFGSQEEVAAFVRAGLRQDSNAAPY